MNLTEPQKRVLQRIATMMERNATAEVVVVLSRGGIRGYRETQTIRPDEMQSSTEAFARVVDG